MTLNKPRRRSQREGERQGSSAITALKGGGFAVVLALLQWCTLSTGAGTLVVNSGLVSRTRFLLALAFCTDFSGHPP